MSKSYWFFEILTKFFLMWSKFIFLKAYTIHKVSRSKNNLEPLNWFPPPSPTPGLLPRSRTPGPIGLRSQGPSWYSSHYDHLNNLATSAILIFRHHGFKLENSRVTSGASHQRKGGDLPAGMQALPVGKMN